jgi:hypothetical protein
MLRLLRLRLCESCDLKDAEIAEQVRRIALDCDSDAVDLERFISATRPKAANDAVPR